MPQDNKSPDLNPPKIALLLADVDEALVTREKILAPRAKAAVAALRAAGIAFTISRNCEGPDSD
jgi:predicted HAD superfamily phosphohydrolase YqeG